MADQQKDDEILGKAYDSQLMRRLLKYVKPYKKYIIPAIFLNIIVSALGPLRPLLTKIAFDENIKNKDFHGLLVICGLLLGTLILQAVIQYFLTYYTELTGQKIVYDLRVQIFSHVQRLALKYFDKTPVGRTVTRVTNDVDSLNEMFSSGIISIFSDIFIVVWILILMLSMSWDL